MIFRLSDTIEFPDPRLAEDDGLLAFGGDLSPERLRLAYRSGIFPWPSEGQPLLWYSPPERFVLFPEKLKVSASMRSVLRSGRFRLTQNQAFPEVLLACADTSRKGQKGTWITPEMRTAYLRLHELGEALSAEAWDKDGLLCGGLYGIPVGKVFCGESMFSRKSNASKAAFINFVQSNNYTLIDCQVYTEHLQSLGAEMIPREQYLEWLKG